MINKVGFTNYKGFASRSYDLKRLNMITGNNGSGKTAIGTALYIAIKGKHPFLGDTMAALKKECSSDTASFYVNDDKINIDRQFQFGEKVPHLLSVNGVNMKIKEGQNLIDEIYPDSMTRLDIGKFSKMNDIERSALLTELLGTSKALPYDETNVILNRYFRLDQESEYVIKYRLNSTPDKYDVIEFIDMMFDQYKKEKSPVILSALNTCDDILNEKGDLMDLSEFLDKGYEQIKKYANTVNQERSFLQKSFAEIAVTNMDSDAIVEGLASVRGKISEVDASYIALSNMQASINTLIPDKSLEEIEASLKSTVEAIETCEKRRSEIATELKTLDEKYADAIKNSELVNKYNDWATKKINIESNIANITSDIDSFKKSLVDVSTETMKSLEDKRTAYISIKSLVSGECPTCGTVISEESAKKRKEEKNAAKLAWDKAEEEINKRRNNENVKRNIEIAEKKLSDLNAQLKEHNAASVVDPGLNRDEVLQNLKSIEAQRNELNKENNANFNDIRSHIDNKESLNKQKDKHTAYDAKIAELTPHLLLHEVDMDNVHKSINDVLSSYKIQKSELNQQLSEYLAAEQLEKKLADDQQIINDKKLMYDVLIVVAELIREYKNETVEKKMAPVQMLAKKYYNNHNDEIVITPKTLGVNRKGQFIDLSVMSSGESLSLVSAIIISIIESSGVKPNFLFIDAGEIDVNNMGILTSALEKSSLDCVLVAHHMPISVTDEWNAIRL